MSGKRPNTLDNIRIKYVTADFSEGMATIKDFIKLSPRKLESTNRKLLFAARSLYKLNDCDPPLYKSFPDKPDRPLTINGPDLFKWSIVPKCGVEISFFRSKENVVSFNDKEDKTVLLRALLHELKHAEQYSLEVEELSQKDGLAHHQIGYLQEAQAYAFEEYIFVLCCLNEKGNTFDRIAKKYPTFKDVFKKSVKKGVLDRTLFEQERMRMWLPQLFKSSYRDDYYERKTIKKDDEGILYIPESFNLVNEAFKKEMLAQLKNVPQLSEWAADMQGRAEISSGTLRAAAINKDIYDILKKEGIINETNIEKVMEFAFREGSIDVLRTIFKEKNPNGEEEPQTPSAPNYTDECNGIIIPPKAVNQYKVPSDVFCPNEGKTR